MTVTYSESPNKLASSAKGIDFAYREVGEGTVPLVLLQHFRGNLDSWDPALVDALAASRRVIAFDNAGVGGSTGITPATIGQMARDALSFLEAMEIARADVLGFSIGSFVAPGMHGWAADVIGAVGSRSTSPDEYLSVFFTESGSSRQAGKDALARMYARQDDRDKATTWDTRLAQYDAVCAWGIPDHAKLERLGAIEAPVFVANGDRDPMILPRYSYLLAGLIPAARIKIYPDSAHGFLFQHHAEFAADVEAFLG
jgi:pimeloyl-ACP methyl ester carboxylesterase